MAAPDPARIAEADALVRQGDVARAAALLEATLEGSDADAPLWLRLAGLRRALGQPRRSLDAVHRALTLAPLDFMALAMRASLLERMGDAEAGRAWDHALVQKPEGDLPPVLTQMIAAGEQVRDAWIAERSEALTEAARREASDADADERAKLDRFRTNILRRTKVYRSEPIYYHYPGLSEREYHPRHRFPWIAELEAATAEIRAEMEALLRSERAELVPYLQYSDHEPIGQMANLNRNRDWTAIHLLRGGKRIDANADMCPRTMALLDRIDQPAITGASPTAMFSLLAPHTTIPPHNGVNNSRLLCHLPLVVPEGCWFRVGAETRPWREGEALIFDDTIEHEASNPTDHLRVVMIFDLWHPDLSAVERRAIAGMIGADGGAPMEG
ncbi:aspartyl beta-hydroxylase [Sphingomonas sp. Root710]|uniref:aspartyl/asparaginyl beta-hydroxylase domain-containing protein n=1 Tax=Sphingomonas sp. Root710 TaxID=1736594 RepID=UPI0006FE8D7F|nr:aspartyl/asparaginyl beta-hydroxylase domain-containing protein [Sphingomonas sp. Root710]KRB82612.1 aspartyl beta-hydroxylase [Sphingomonas sp. Root710]